MKRSTDTPAVPAPASHSGEAVKLAQAIIADHAHRPPGERSVIVAEALLSLSASAARLTEELQQTRAALAPLDAVVHALGIEDTDEDPAAAIETMKAEAARLTETNKVLDERAVHWHMRAIKAETGARRLREALEQARDKFREYAKAHLAKDPPAELRALANRHMAEMCDRALVSPAAGAEEARTSPVTQDEMDDCYQGGKAPAAGAEEARKQWPEKDDDGDEMCVC